MGKPARPVWREKLAELDLTSVMVTLRGKHKSESPGQYDKRWGSWDPPLAVPVPSGMPLSLHTSWNPHCLSQVLSNPLRCEEFEAWQGGAGVQPERGTPRLPTPSPHLMRVSQQDGHQFSSPPFCSPQPISQNLMRAC